MSATNFATMPLDAVGDPIDMGPPEANGTADGSGDDTMGNVEDAEAIPYDDRAATPLENEDDDDDDSDDDDIQIRIGDIRPNVPFQAMQKGIGSGSQTIGKALDIDATAEVNGQPIYDLDLVSIEDKPWRKPGADITDYFNYGFTEETWNLYCERQRKLRHEYGNTSVANRVLFGQISIAGPPGSGMNASNATGIPLQQGIPTIAGGHTQAARAPTTVTNLVADSPKLRVNLAEKYANSTPPIGLHGHAGGAGPNAPAPVLRTVLTTNIQQPTQVSVSSAPPPQPQPASQQISTISVLGASAPQMLPPQLTQLPPSIVKCEPCEPPPLTSATTSTISTVASVPAPISTVGVVGSDAVTTAPSSATGTPTRIAQQADVPPGAVISRSRFLFDTAMGISPGPPVTPTVPPGPTVSLPEPSTSTTVTSAPPVSTQPPPQTISTVGTQQQTQAPLGPPPARPPGLPPQTVNVSLPPPRFNPTQQPPPQLISTLPPHVHQMPPHMQQMPPTNLPPPGHRYPSHPLPPGVSAPPPGYTFPPPPGVRAPMPSAPYSGFGPPGAGPPPGFPQPGIGAPPPRHDDSDRSPASYSDKSSDIDDDNADRNSSFDRSGSSYHGGGRGGGRGASRRGGYHRGGSPSSSSSYRPRGRTYKPDPDGPPPQPSERSSRRKRSRSDDRRESRSSRRSRKDDESSRRSKRSKRVESRSRSRSAEKSKEDSSKSSKTKRTRTKEIKKEIEHSD